MHRHIGLVDGNYYLFRNKSSIANRGGLHKISASELFRLNLYTYMKFKRDFAECDPPIEIDHLILLWDSRPYKKAESLEQYKSDRYVASDVIDELSEVDRSKLSEEELKKIDEELAKAEIEDHNFHVAQDVKYKTISELGPLGFPSIIKKGYEADDLAYLFSRYLNNLGYTVHLISVDKDWVTFVNDKTSFMSTYNWSNYQDILDEAEPYLKDIPNMSLYEYGVLCELYEGSHNFVPEYPHQKSFTEFASGIINKDETLPDYKERRSLFDAFNMSSHPEYTEDLKSLFDYTLSIYDKYIPGEFNTWVLKNFINMNMDKYNEYVNNKISFNP